MLKLKVRGEMFREFMETERSKANPQTPLAGSSLGHGLGICKLQYQEVIAYIEALIYVKHFILYSPSVFQHLISLVHHYLNLEHQLADNTRTPGRFRHGDESPRPGRPH
jgi:hypothetical protein